MTVWLGVLALGFFAAHGGYHLLHGRPHDVLWICTVAPALVGVGLLGSWPAWVGVGVLWLVAGLPLWLLDLAGGGEFLPTSLLTHLGGLGVGLYGLWRLGLPAGVWWKAFLGLAVLQQLCRWLTPRAANVNLAFTVHPGWESWFPSYRWSWLALAGLLLVVFFALEQGLRKLVPA
jgi:hypothetical protein